MLVKIVHVATHLSRSLFHVDRCANRCSSSEKVKLRDRTSQNDATHRDAECEHFALLHLAVFVVQMSSWLAKVIERSGTVKLVCFEHQLVTTSVFPSRPITDYNNAESSGHK